MKPHVDNSITLGSYTNKWANVYATNFTGDLSGNATTVSKANLETMLLECYINGTARYQQKFTMQAAISVLTTVEEVDNYQVVFNMMNFYNQ